LLNKLEVSHSLMSGVRTVIIMDSKGTQVQDSLSTRGTAGQLTC